MPRQSVTHSAEFKQEAVRLVLSSGKSCAEVARDLGIADYLLVRWKRQHEAREASGKPSFTGRGVPARSAQELRIAQLERELEIARQERDVLKKAVAYLGQNGRP
ncbi:transposase [Deinococcus peraridilitoris]|uniref:Transposase n=1 Tax=Deinococcus peraridilitoris (strain DSM 19664 / LMG 22246 / CIP 109416 / KR-200) TaxID=937777 RepID=L0A7F6_DEIPD|nr:transposase [Deinococcus peraridilitoris]AFZ69389.1 transposase [Deinococcus peraridilitoris DSM 19664]AFZ69458.1 transposase [Deinococcus peraridilitoris DSM 19664]